MNIKYDLCSLEVLLGKGQLTVEEHGPDIVRLKREMTVNVLLFCINQPLKKSEVTN